MRPRGSTRAEAPATVTPLRLSPEEKAIVRQAAKVNGQDFSAFARDALLTAASECLEGVIAPSRTCRVVIMSSSGVIR